MNTPQATIPLLLFMQTEIPLWLLVGIIILLGSVMCLQLYLAVKKMERGCLAGENGTREEQPAGLLSGYPVVYLIHSRIKGKSYLEIISIGTVLSNNEIALMYSNKLKKNRKQT